MKNDIQLETAIDFIRRDRKNAELALLVAAAVPALQQHVRGRISAAVTEELRKFRRPNWSLDEHWGRGKRLWRLRLHKKDGHWSEKRFSGVWFQWDGDDGMGFRVGIEWPQDHGTSLDESIRECFRTADVELSARQEGGGDSGRPTTWWFFGYPAGDDWVGWDCLLVKTDEEIPQFVTATVGFMKRLVEVIERADLP